MTLTENTNYEAFTKFLEQECMRETIYNDSEGRRILVLRLLDAFTMAHSWGVRMARDEREAILQMSRDQWFKTQAEFEAAIQAREQQTWNKHV